MKTARTRLAFSVLIVFAMVSSGLGVSALFRSTAPAVSGPTGDLGTRSETPQTVSLMGTNMNEVQESNLPTQQLTEQTNPVARVLDHDEMQAVESAPLTDTVTTTIISNEAGTRNPFFDAGGPYGGPNCFEGSCTVHFEAITDDPTIIFYRWDFNNDGVWDTSWSTDNFVDKVFYDNYYGLINAEGWDGISTTTNIYTGDIQGGGLAWQWYIYPLNSGWKFRSKVDMSITQLGYYKYAWTYASLSLRVYQFSSQALLGSCVPSTSTNYAWHWCTLGAPIALTTGTEYVVSYHKSVDYYPYWIGIYNNQLPPTAWNKVEYQGYYYNWGMPYRMPSASGGNDPIPKLDFRWRQVEIVPLTQKDTAFLDVNNAAPQPYGIVTDPVPGLEGTPVKFSAWFNDPGSEDDWQFRWYFGDGSWSAWQKVKKFNGGASVLFYHTITGNEADLINRFTDLCGNFCVQIDRYDFGPLGFNAHLTLADFMKYDVIYVAINYFPTISMAPLGNALADYVDQKGDQGSGGVILETGALITGSTAITGRWQTDGYYPVNPAGYAFTATSMGTIYQPGHPLLDGITGLTSAMQANIYSVTAGASRIADWTNGKVMLATKLNPMVSNGARVVALNDFAPWYQCSGDCHQIVVNAVKWSSRQPDPTPMPMPIQLPWVSHFYSDDDPVTTSPEDIIDVKVEVKDDDHLKVEGTTTLVLTQNFQTGCSGYTFPTGWVNNPYYGWRCEYSGELSSNSAVVRYYYNDYQTSLLTGPTSDLSMYNAAKLEWRNYWWANFGGATQDGYVEVSIDGGITFPYIIKEFHHMDPGGPETKTYTADIPAVSNNMKIRFRFVSGFDWYWIVDDIKLYGTQGRLVWGLGEAWGTATIANVPPSVVGGPQSGSRVEAQSFLVDGLIISDPALMAPTEWFAYKMDFDDGTPSSWVYKGSLAPPKLDVLFVHAVCTSGNGCASYTSISSRILAMDLGGSVTGYNWFQSLSAPTLSYMMQFDVVLFGVEWAYLNFPPYEAAKLLIGNRLADYLDAHAGGVVTFMATYDLSQYYGELFSLTGRYIDQDYGPFEKEVYPFGAATLGQVHYPNHPIMKGVTDVTSGAIHSGNLPTTVGGLRLASWNDGGAAVGAKAKDGDKLSCAINWYTGSIGGAHASTLLRNCLGWVVGGIPSADIPPVTHTWGDNGVYTVDVAAIDDDMGYVWDFTNNVPLADPMYRQVPPSHRYIAVSVDNVDPTIHSTAAYTEADLCIRLAGNKGNDATLTVMGTDGSYYTVTTTRVPGQPNIGCLPTIRIDMTPSTQYTFTIAYDPTGDDGANPEWIFSSEFPDGKIKELRYTFNSNNGPQVITVGNKEFKRLAVGSPLTFEATASDPGSDDLAFAWIWSDLTPYDLHIYSHPGVFYTSAVSDLLSMLPFKEPRFDFTANDMRTPEVDPIRALDTATHQFAETQMPYFLYVMLIVADDDNGDPYTSPYLWPGMDLEVVQIDL